MQAAIPNMRCLIGFILICVWSVPTSAGIIGLNTWYEFGFDPNHAPLVAGCQPVDLTGVPCRAGIDSTFLDGSPWTFVNASPTRLTVTDAFLPGDSFDIFDFGAAVGSTPSVSIGGASCGLDASICIVDPSISHATFLLAGGAHSLTIEVHAAQILGEGFFRLDAVPEPSTFGLVALVFAFVGGYRKLCLARKRSFTSQVPSRLL